jgi:hypothetical protein
MTTAPSLLPNCAVTPTGHPFAELLLAAALNTCARCHGFGQTPGHWGHAIACNCALRRVFRDCLSRYWHEQENMVRGNSAVRLEAFQSAVCRGRRSHTYLVCANKSAEYSADFVITARAELRPWELELFDRHFLKGEPWYRCIGPLHIDRGNFFHAVYRIERTLGQALIERGMYPTRDYFALAASFASRGRRGGAPGLNWDQRPWQLGLAAA